MAKKHVLVLAFPAYGHIIPMLELARKLSLHHFVTFAVSKIKLEALKKREIFSDGSDAGLTWLGIEDGIVSDIDDPEDLEAFKLVFTAVFPAVRKLIEEIPVCVPSVQEHLVDAGQQSASSDSKVQMIRRPVDAIISDNFLAVSMQYCRERKIPFFLFNTAAADLMRYYLLVNENNPTVSMQDSDPFMALPGPGEKFQGLTAELQSLFAPVRKMIPFTAGIIHNTFAAIDKESLQILAKEPELINTPMFSVGPLMPTIAGKTSAAHLSTEGSVTAWLDKKDPRSVGYVSFGSMMIPAPEQITELGKALLQLNRPFIFSLRESRHQYLPQEIKEKIIKQFEREGGDFLILEWAPQKSILAHPAVAAFLSHCGWNSILESLSSGVPLIAWPMFADQLTNAQWLEKLRLAFFISGTGMKPKRVVPAKEITEAIAEVAGFGADASHGDNRYMCAAQLWKREIEDAWSVDGSSTKDTVALAKAISNTQ